MADLTSSPSGHATAGGFTYPPRPLAVIMGLWLAVSLAAFAPGERLANWVGYVVGAWLVAATALLYRKLDRTGRLRSSSSYVPLPRLNQFVAAAVASGWLIAAIHAYFLAKERRLA